MTFSSGEIELLAFNISGKVLGMDILAIQEVTKVSGITATPRTPDYVEGIINLRGNIVTIINLGSKLGLEPVRKQKENPVIVLSHDGELVGLMIDDINAVVHCDTEAFDPPPASLNGTQGKFYKGVLKTPDLLVGVLEIDKIFVL